MSIDKDRLLAHLDDYYEVTEKKTDHFICPITLRECDEDELINGHILNKAIDKASRCQVIQYREVDHFYGTRVEPGLIRYLNLKRKSMSDMIRESGELRVTLAGGSAVPAFWVGPAKAKHAQKRFPLVDLLHKGERVESVFLKIPCDSPLLHGAVEVTTTECFCPYDWVAALLKVAHLTQFDMLGYSAVFDAFGNTLRHSLCQFFIDRATNEQAEKYFGDLRDCMRVILTSSENDAGEKTQHPYPFDTLTDRHVLLHRTPGEQIFAATYIYKVNDATITVTLPQCNSGVDPGLVLDWYKCCTKDPHARPQQIHRAHFDGSTWQVVQEPAKLGVIPAD